MRLLKGIAPQPGTRQSCFRTLAVGTNPAEISVAAWLEQEYIELMAGDADASACLEGLPQRGGSRAAQLAEPMLRVDPHRQIEIAALVPDLDARATEFAEPGTSFQSGFATDPMTAIASISGNAIQDCVTIGGFAEFALAPQEVTVLLFDLRALHDSPKQLYHTAFGAIEG
ncbi:hypothetical protein AB6802_22865 [Mesorhizobium sp. RCC_202]|uniref:hypothetical protein n=1 Tax=Mesorhizobium sp. RCC_202 TaxID=3239222 RepID=UPI0035261666